MLRASIDTSRLMTKQVWTRCLLHERALTSFFVFALYLIFVWSLAYVRRDYLWITGDDANLLEQSLLITRGFIPNIDFFSGYPGLSLQLHAWIIEIFGAAPLTQHIYLALQASAFGLALFWVGKDAKPWLVLLLLVFTYSQGMLLNTTPNPGYLFQTMFVLGLKKSLDYFGDGNMSAAAWAGFFFAVSFLAKQYGIFGPLCFFIATLVLLDVCPSLRRSLSGAALSICVALILYVYLGHPVSDRTQHELLVKNAIVFALPVLASLLSILALRSNPPEGGVTFSTAVRANLVLSAVFLVTVLLYFVLVYGVNNLVYVIREIMILAPRKINNQVLAVAFLQTRSWQIAYALAVIFLPLVALRCVAWRYASTGHLLSGIFAASVVFDSGNLSATPFIAIAFVIVVMVAFFLVVGSERRHILALLAGFAPCLLILTPYPNYAYHIPVLVFFALVCYQPPRLGLAAGAARFLSLSDLFPLFAIVIAGAHAVVGASLQMDGFKTYNFKSTSFRSGDPAWAGAIEEAHRVDRGVATCSTYACRYLLLTLPSFNDYQKVIETPLGKQ